MNEILATALVFVLLLAATFAIILAVATAAVAAIRWQWRDTRRKAGPGWERIKRTAAVWVGDM